jgi:hypothetical protein
MKLTIQMPSSTSFDADPLASECGQEVDFLAIDADAAAGCDEDVAVVEGAGEVR